MRRYRNWLVGLLLGAAMLTAFMFHPRATLAETPEPGSLDVTGHGVMKVKYDQATINLGVTQLRETPTAAFNAMSEDMNKVAAALKAMGITEDQLKTGVLSLDAQYDWVQNEGQKLRGYRATNSITVTTQDLDKVATLIQTAVSNGANQLNGLSFSVKDTDALQNQALDLAVDDAKAKADRVAKRLGAVVAGPRRVTIQDAGRPITYAPTAYAGAMKADAALPAPVFSGGTMEYSVTVSVTFDLR